MEIDMTDTVDKRTRSWVMSRVRGKDTVPELTVRRLVFSLGYRYRLHDRRLPGKPDLVFSGISKVIFIHGCFWHRHEGCPMARIPKSRTSFWLHKLSSNSERDTRSLAMLEVLGWRVMVIWECELGDLRALRMRVSKFLGVAGASPR